MWHIATTRVAGGFEIFTLDMNSTAGMKRAGGAVRVDVGPGDEPWVANAYGEVFRYHGAGWEVATSGVHARDVGVGGDGSVFVVGTDGRAYKWNGSGWVDRGGGNLTQISVSDTGVPVAFDANSQVWLGQP